MDTYRVVTAPPGIELKLGSYNGDMNTYYVKADNFVDAVIEANFRAGINQRIIEVALSQPFVQIEDEDLEHAIRNWLDENGWDPDQFEEFGGYMADDFHFWAQRMVEMLRDKEIIPNASLSLVADGDGVVDYSMIELSQYDHTYRAIGSEVKHLTTDRDAEGIPGLVAICPSMVMDLNRAR